MCFEGMEESGSEGLDDLITAEKDKFFKGVDCVCISGEFRLSIIHERTLRLSSLAFPSDNYCMYSNVLCRRSLYTESAAP